MKYSEAIDRANELRPNAILDARKAEWLYFYDAENAEIMGQTQERLNWPDTDPDLMMPAPYDYIYPLYLMAMIDNAQEESDLYMNDMTIANQALMEARAAWRRNHRTPRGKVVLV